MKKIIKSLLCIMAVLALCLTIAPTQVSMAAEVDYTKLTQEQLEAICFGTWDSFGSYYDISETGVTANGELWIGWNYEGMVEFSEAILDNDDFELFYEKRFGICSLEEYIDGYLDEDMTPEEVEEATSTATEEYNRIMTHNPDGVTNALKFTNGDNKYYMYYGLDGTVGESSLVIHMMFDDGSQKLSPMFFRVVNVSEEDDESLRFYEIVERLDEFMTEAPATEKVEEPATEDVTTEKPEETTTSEPSEEVTTAEKTEEPATTDKVDSVTEGEVEYTVKKGDCLWAIARQFYGNGKFYTHIFERNTDIIKKPELIHTGWKLIIPVLDK